MPKSTKKSAETATHNLARLFVEEETEKLRRINLIFNLFCSKAKEKKTDNITFMYHIVCYKPIQCILICVLALFCFRLNL